MIYMSFESQYATSY